MIKDNSNPRKDRRRIRSSTSAKKKKIVQRRKRHREKRELRRQREEAEWNAERVANTAASHHIVYPAVVEGDGVLPSTASKACAKSFAAPKSAASESSEERELAVATEKLNLDSKSPRGTSMNSKQSHNTRGKGKRRMKKAQVQTQAAVSFCFSCSRTSGTTRFSRTQLQRPPYLRRCNVCVAKTKARNVSAHKMLISQLEGLDYSTYDPRLWDRAAIESWATRVLSQSITDDEQRWIDDVTSAGTPSVTATPVTNVPTSTTPSAAPPSAAAAEILGPIASAERVQALALATNHGYTLVDMSHKELKRLAGYQSKDGLEAILARKRIHRELACMRNAVIARHDAIMMASVVAVTRDSEGDAFGAELCTNSGSSGVMETTANT